ncbi:uncharacterized protein RHO25_006056 [Cercospora beticola]|uniref:Uncharacterized protein n=1 Tax=Cercospora beticola TaxID=122368 RepID=A0ABZ0NPH2_CERBT|nr:hypothetical protein RHO25_006056 [Cercospora beticola]
MAFLTRFWKSSNELKKDEFRRKLDLAGPQPDDTCIVCYDEDEPTHSASLTYKSPEE